MQFFEEKGKTLAPEVVLSSLFKEFKEVGNEQPSKTISPSCLNCQTCAALKLAGAPFAPSKESFQSRSFADAGTDRHARIQEFLSTTDYWIHIPTYIAKKKLPLEVLAEDGYEVLLWSEQYQTRFRCDGMLNIGGITYVLEIKTERQAMNSGRIAPNEKHLKQAYAYSLLLDCPDIMWLYEGRDLLEQKFIHQHITPEEKAYIKKYIEDIIKFKDDPSKLERDPNCNTQFSAYCKMIHKEREKRERLNGTRN